MQKMDNSSVFDHSNDENVTWDTWWFNNIHIRSHSACYMLWLAIFVHFHHLNGQNSRIIRFQHYFFIFHHFTKLPLVLKIANMHVLHHLRHLRWQFTFFFIKPFLDPIFHGEHDATLQNTRKGRESGVPSLSKNSYTYSFQGPYIYTQSTIKGVES